MTTPKILTEEEVNKIEQVNDVWETEPHTEIENLIFSLRTSRQEVEALKAENRKIALLFAQEFDQLRAELARLKEAIPGEEEQKAKVFDALTVGTKMDAIREEIMLEIDDAGYTEETFTQEILEKMFLERAAIARLQYDWFRSRLADALASKEEGK